MRETYKDIPDHDGYKVSLSGVVINKRNKILKPHKDKDGYLRVVPYVNGAYKPLSIHRAIALSYIPNPKGLPCVNHKNEIKTDNSVDNLEWCTVKHNNRHSKALKQYKLSDAKAVEIRSLYKKGGISHYKIAKEYGVAPNAIMQILKFKSYAGDI